MTKYEGRAAQETPSYNRQTVMALFCRFDQLRPFSSFVIRHSASRSPSFHSAS